MILACTAIGQSPPGSGRLLTLRAVLDSIQTNHPTAKAALSRVRAAEGNRVTAGALGNPVLGYQVDQTPFPGGHPIPPDMRREAMTTATLPLEFLYQRGPRIARANADIRSTQAEATSTRQRLGLDAATAYFRVGVAQVRSATTHDLLSWLDSLVTYNRSRVEEGVAAEADLIRSQLERDRVATEASMNDADLARARAELGALITSAASSAPLPAIAIEDTPVLIPASLARLVGQARDPSVSLGATIDQRPDVRAARERVTASTAAIAIERSMLFRQLGATIGTMQTERTTSMIAGLSVPIPMFDRNRGEIQRASAERDAAAFELAAQERSANAELRGAADAARILTDRTTLLARRDSTGFLARADELRRIALGAYREGAVPLFQVIDAARSWAEARTIYYEAIAAQHQSVLSLIVAAGMDVFTAVPAVSTQNNGGGAAR